MKNLSIKNINKSFFQEDRQINVIKNASLEIKKGQSVALVGPSGAGKTTFLQIAGLLDVPDSGQIIIANIEASKADDKTRTNLRRDHIGFIYQFHHLLPEFSAIENVAMPLLIKGFAKKVALEQAEQLLIEIGLADRTKHLPSQLSGGQQQRVAVARAIITHPSLLLADEPTGNLDSESANNVFNLILKFSKKYQISSLIVTHNLELARKMDKLIAIKDGILQDFSE